MVKKIMIMKRVRNSTR